MRRKHKAGSDWGSVVMSSRPEILRASSLFFLSPVLALPKSWCLTLPRLHDDYTTTHKYEKQTRRTQSFDKCSSCLLFCLFVSSSLPAGRLRLAFLLLLLQGGGVLNVYPPPPAFNLKAVLACPQLTHLLARTYINYKKREKLTSPERPLAAPTTLPCFT